MLWRYLFTLLFALQVAFAPWLSSASRIGVQAQADDDLLLVCTGSSYRWVSLSQTASAGDFVFVDVEDTPEPVEEPHTPTCLLGWLQLDQSLVADVVNLPVVEFTPLYNPFSIVSAFVEPAFSYSSRAPPSPLIA